eukprot:gene10824-biopygen13884
MPAPRPRQTEWSSHASRSTPMTGRVHLFLAAAVNAAISNPLDLTTSHNLGGGVTAACGTQRSEGDGRRRLRLRSTPQTTGEKSGAAGAAREKRDGATQLLVQDAFNSVLACHSHLNAVSRRPRCPPRSSRRRASASCGPRCRGGTW